MIQKVTAARWLAISLGLLLLARSADAGPAEIGEKIKVKTPDKQTVVVFKPRGEEIKIKFVDGGRERVLRGKLKDSGKREYEEEGGARENIYAEQRGSLVHPDTGTGDRAHEPPQT